MHDWPWNIGRSVCKAHNSHFSSFMSVASFMDERQTPKMVNEFISLIIVHVLTFYMYYFVHVYENIWLAGDYNCVYLIYSNDIRCTSQNIMKLPINDFYKIIKIIDFTKNDFGDISAVEHMFL